MNIRHSSQHGIVGSSAVSPVGILFVESSSRKGIRQLLETSKTHVAIDSVQ